VASIDKPTEISNPWPTPSLLSKKILCPAYRPAPFDRNQIYRFLGFHAITVVSVIARHIKKGYTLKDIEKRFKGVRIDLVFETPTGLTRIVEVKSSRQIREVHKIQAALYGKHIGDEVVVSNRNQDVILDPGFIYATNNEAENVRGFLASDPKKAAVTYRPHKDACYTCGNNACPFLGMQNESRS
jgi:hypothetical protein